MLLLGSHTPPRPSATLFDFLKASSRVEFVGCTFRSWKHRDFLQAAAVRVHQIDRGAAEVGGVAFEDDKVSIRRKGWVPVMEATEVILAVVREGLQARAVGIDDGDLGRLRVAEVSEGYEFGSIGGPIRADEARFRIGNAA